MKIEFIFHRNKLTLDAGEVQQRVTTRLNTLSFHDKLKVINTTVMGKWLVVLIEFFQLQEISYPLAAFDIVAGSIVIELQDCAVRYLHFEIHKRTGSLIYKKNWRYPRITLNCIVKDEGPHLSDFFSHIREYVDDVVAVIDSRTEDNSADMAKECGARVFFKQWKNDFSKLRNEALAQTAYEWVISLDVDERASPDLLENLRELVQTKDYDAYELIKVNLVTNEEVPQVRLFKRKCGRWEGRVHEIVRGIPEDRVKKTNYKIFHHQRWMTLGDDVIAKRNMEYRSLEKTNK